NIVLVRCGQGGIGEALAKEFRRNGYTVIGTVLPSETADHLVFDGIKSFTCDVTKEESVERLLEHVEELVGANRLDVLVNNAYEGYTMPATDHSIPEVERMFAVNVFGPMRMVQRFHHLLVAAKGVVINISSVGGVVPYIYGSSYNASKAALVQWGNTLRVEMQPFDVKVINVISGEIGTNILKSDRNRELPPRSIYQPLADEFKAHVQRIPKTTTADEYARGVVKEAMKAHPSAHYWRGENSALVRWVDVFLPRTFWDGVFARWFQFEKLKPGAKKAASLMKQANDAASGEMA
ncbi:hypothetical protein EDC01DRAFT_750264, partial [Geopyxis carbonaria]